MYWDNAIYYQELSLNLELKIASPQDMYMFKGI